jgi:hypothetical protein
MAQQNAARTLRGVRNPGRFTSTGDWGTTGWLVWAPRLQDLPLYRAYLLPVDADEVYRTIGEPGGDGGASAIMSDVEGWAGNAVDDTLTGAVAGEKVSLGLEAPGGFSGADLVSPVQAGAAGALADQRFGGGEPMELRIHGVSGSDGPTMLQHPHVV